ncbi:MAG: PhoH family protein [Fibrobacteria bacterium]|nr:PhoH family protein [Fibrobacteria bacterium]
MSPIPLRSRVLEDISDQAKSVLLRDKEVLLTRLEDVHGVRVVARDAGFLLEGGDDLSQGKVVALLRKLVQIAQDAGEIEPSVLDVLLEAEGTQGLLADDFSRPILHDARGQAVRPRTLGQHRLVRAVRSNDLVFAIGPAGTGKTYLAIAMAVAALQRREVDRLVLVRPAVEAGEELGFLPGDLKEKIAPYLQPMMDALQELLPRPRFKEAMEDGTIEMAPLAYMRGRTLKRSFAILDEAQNATVPQMKMFLTRLGTHSRAIVTGDPTQVDLPAKTVSGLAHACEILDPVEGIRQVHLESRDQMRHPLVQSIIDAYDSHSALVRMNSNVGSRS